DLQFEIAMALGSDQGLGFLDILGGIAAGQGPQYRDVLMYSSAKQSRQRLVQTLAEQVQQRGFNGRFGQIVAATGAIQHYPESIDVICQLTNQLWCEIGVDGKFDALGTF